MSKACGGLCAGSTIPLERALSRWRLPPNPRVMSMDTTLPGNALMHRAITDKGAWSVAYAVIITIN
jgi:hypothetical protein